MRIGWVFSQLSFAPPEPLSIFLDRVLTQVWRKLMEDFEKGAERGDLNALRVGRIDLGTRRASQPLLIRMLLKGMTASTNQHSLLHQTKPESEPDIRKVTRTHQHERIRNRAIPHK
jgi:hypothetical protein